MALESAAARATMVVNGVIVVVAVVVMELVVESLVLEEEEDEDGGEEEALDDGTGDWGVRSPETERVTKLVLLVVVAAAADAGGDWAMGEVTREGVSFFGDTSGLGEMEEDLCCGTRDS